MAADPRPVSSFLDTFYNLAIQSSDPNIQKLTKTFIVHYDLEEAMKNCSENKV